MMILGWLERPEYLLASNAVGVEGLVEILHHVGPHVGRPADSAVLDGLESLGDSPQNPEPRTSKGVLGALEVVHLQSQVPDQVIVDEGDWGGRQLLRTEHGEGPPLDGEDVLLHLGGVVLVGRGEHLAL